MTDISRDSAVTQAIALMIGYGFDSKNTVREMVFGWLKQYSVFWIRLAVVEALYLGRYKVVSVEQILSGWRRRGNPSIHFNRDFECLICRNLPRNLAETKYISRPTTVFRRPRQRRSQYRAAAHAAPSSPSHRLDRQKSTTTIKQKSVIPVAAQSTIEQFTPSSETSEIYWKLKAVASKP